jgi:hypothetical protein
MSQQSSASFLLKSNASALAAKFRQAHDAKKKCLGRVPDLSVTRLLLVRKGMPAPRTIRIKAKCRKLPDKYLMEKTSED